MRLLAGARRTSLLAVVAVALSVVGLWYVPPASATSAPGWQIQYAGWISEGGAYSSAQNVTPTRFFAWQGSSGTALARFRYACSDGVTVASAVTSFDATAYPTLGFQDTMTCAEGSTVTYAAISSDDGANYVTWGTAPSGPVCNADDQSGCGTGAGVSGSDPDCAKYLTTTVFPACLRWGSQVPSGYVRSWTFSVKLDAPGVDALNPHTWHYLIGYACAGDTSAHEEYLNIGAGATRSYPVLCTETYVERFYALGEGTANLDYNHVRLAWGARPGSALTPWTGAVSTRDPGVCGPGSNDWAAGSGSGDWLGPAGDASPPDTTTPQVYGDCSEDWGVGAPPATGTPAPTDTGTALTPPTLPGQPGASGGAGCSVSILDPSSWLCGLTSLFGDLLDVLHHVLSWLYDLGKLLLSLFVPNVNDLKNSVNQLTTAWNGTPFGTFSDALGQLVAPLTGLASASAGDCGGPTFTFHFIDFSVQPFAACDGLPQRASQLVLPIEAFFVYAGGFFLWFRMLGATIGLRTPEEA